MNCFADCAKHTRGNENNINYEYGNFYRKDCLCDVHKNSCDKIYLYEKALRFIRKYPYIPTGYCGESNIMGNEQIIAKHRELVDEFNRIAEIYNDFYKQTKIGRATKPLRYML
jgi:hypothetical protein